MKIAIITPVFPPYTGGIGNVAYHNAVQLKRLGHQITVFTPDYGQKNFETDFKIEKVWPLLRQGNAAFLPTLPAKLSNFDIVHLHYPFFGSAELIYWAKKKAFWKLVLHYHMDVVGIGLLGKFFKTYTKIFLPKIVKISDKIIVTSFDYAKNSKLAKYLKNQPQKFIEIPNGVDIQKFRPAGKDWQLEAIYKVAGHKVILFVGGLDKAHYFKGVSYLLKAFKEIPNSAKLVIVGSGNLLDYYKRLAKKLGVEKDIRFAGKVGASDLPRYFNTADVVVLPSIDKSEAFGLVLVEAMACGKPVVASNLPGVRSVVGKSGLLAEPKNINDLTAKIEKILTDEKLAQKMGESGRQKVEVKYSWQKIAVTLDNLYNSLVPQSRP
jgi:glycosyltransferase involved in cell wall biosynthesis